MVEKLTAERPDVHVERLTGIGHYPMMEAPGAFTAALLRRARLSARSSHGSCDSIQRSRAGPLSKLEMSA